MTGEDTTRSRAVAALVGLAVGDAVGTTLEFTERRQVPLLTDMVGGGPFRLAPGEWTDDTSMALCLADSLLENDGRIIPVDLLARWADWWRSGHNSVNGRCFDIGGATRTALQNFISIGRTVNNEEEDRQANGSIMRLAPVAICSASREEAISLALAQGRTTHAATVPQRCCRQLAILLWDAIETGDMPDAVRGIGMLDRGEIDSSGHAPATLRAASWAVATTPDFESAVLAAANLGGDADTVAAVAGQMAGALYGLSGIPRRWLERLAWRDEIVDRGERLWALRTARRAP